MLQETNKVVDFLESDYFINSDILNEFFHEDAIIHWRSSEAFYELDLKGFGELTTKMGKSFLNMTAEFHDVITTHHSVVTHFTYFVESIESEELHALAHFMAIWKLEDAKIIKAEIMSMPAEDEIEVKKQI
ncbi:MAG: hypothetical protein ACPHVL_05760 [Psychroflexus salarius]